MCQYRLNHRSRYFKHSMRIHEEKPELFLLMLQKYLTKFDLKLWTQINKEVTFKQSLIIEVAIDSNQMFEIFQVY